MIIDGVLIDYDIRYFFEGNWPDLMNEYQGYLKNVEIAIDPNDWISSVCIQLEEENNTSRDVWEHFALMFYEEIAFMWREYYQNITMISSWEDLLRRCNGLGQAVPLYCSAWTVRHNAMRSIFLCIEEFEDKEGHDILDDLINNGWKENQIVELDYRLSKGVYPMITKCLQLFIEGSSVSFEQIMRKCAPYLLEIVNRVEGSETKRQMFLSSDLVVLENSAV